MPRWNPHFAFVYVVQKIAKRPLILSNKKSLEGQMRQWIKHPLTEILSKKVPQFCNMQQVALFCFVHSVKCSYRLSIVQSRKSVKPLQYHLLVLSASISPCGATIDRRVALSASLSS